MPMQRTIRALIAGAALSALAHSAQAATITQILDFSASGFGAGAPVDPVTGSFTVTYDPTLTYSNDTADITLSSLNITLDPTFGFSYSSSLNQMFVGSTLNDVAGVVGGTNDFSLTISTASTTPTFGFLQYAQGTDSVFQTTTGTVTPSVSVPEPASMAVLGAGLVGLGVARRRRRG